MRKKFLAILIGLLLWSGSLVAESKTVRPVRPSTSRPNILFAIADDWSYGHAGAYGAAWVKTPAFDRVARSGLLFTRAYTPNAKCAPSRAIILTGRNSWQLEEAANHIPYFPAKFKTWVEALRDEGYFAGLTTKGWGPGVALDATGKPREMAGRPFNSHKLTPSTTGIGSNDYAANFADFLKAAPRQSPWSFWYGAIEPHREYEYGSGVRKGGKRLAEIPRIPSFWPDNEIVRNDMLDYALEVEHFDLHLGRMIEMLEESGQLERTIIIVTSDHGMPFPRSKGQAYDYSNHVPLAIMWGGGISQPGRTIDDYVSFADLAPTMLEIAGLSRDRSGMASISGESLTSLFRSTRSGRVTPRRDHVLVGKERTDIGRPHDVGYPIRGIVKNDMLYLRNYETDRWPTGNPETGYLDCDAGATKTLILQERRDRGTSRSWDLGFGKRVGEELYDLKRDPDCVNNLATVRGYSTLKARLRRQMEQELKQQGDPRMMGNGAIFDRYLYADPANRDFYNRFMRGEKLRAGWVLDSDFEQSPLR
jgi:N-sulfoglucosamine sulfohydrolase